MAIEGTNPATGELLWRHQSMTATDVQIALDGAGPAACRWAALPWAGRQGYLRQVAALLRAERDELAALMTREMGKLIAESRAEIDKCALVCDHYADHAAGYLVDELIESDADRSLVTCQPLGAVLAVMPWNFPFWQVFRCAAPALAAGNVVLLKHASNVPGCAQRIESLMRDALSAADLDAKEYGGIFSNLRIPAAMVEQVLKDPVVRAVSLTGSDAAGRRVAAMAGESLKKCVLELGGSDAFVVLDDADLDVALDIGMKARFINAGQSCIAAKRFILLPGIADDFVARLRERIAALRPGDPAQPSTSLAPLAREDLRDELSRQVRGSIAAGAELLVGGEPLPGPGWFYAPTLLDRVTPGMPAYDDELFGPVAAVIRAQDEADALRIANDSRFGLGGSVWTGDSGRGERFARRMACGAAFVNGLVKSDPRLPFGGVGDSGYGRELSREGIREFVNLKMLWVK